MKTINTYMYNLNKDGQHQLINSFKCTECRMRKLYCTESKLKTSCFFAQRVLNKTKGSMLTADHSVECLDIYVTPSKNQTIDMVRYIVEDLKAQFKSRTK